MRICITRSERYSYSETFIRNQIAGLSRLADVFTVHSGRLPERNEEDVLLGSYFFWLLHKVVKTVTGERNNYFGNYGLKKYLRSNEIEVVLANYGMSAAHMVPICRDLNLPLLAIFHGHDATDRKLLKQYEKKYMSLFAYASVVIAVSQEMRAAFIRLGADPIKIKVIPYGIDIEKFKPSEQPKEPLFIAVGRFVEKKAPHLTIEAFHKVWKKYPGTKLIMVGKQTGLFEKCSQMVHNLGMDRAVDFPGVQTQEEISKLMSKAMAFVQHSVTAPNGDMEGTPVSILEAAAVGLPVISTFHAGIKEAVVHNVTGFLVEEGNVQGMSEYMMKVIEEPSMAASMGREARLHIEAHYTQEKQIQGIYKLAIEAVDHHNKKRKRSTLTV